MQRCVCPHLTYTGTNFSELLSLKMSLQNETLRPETEKRPRRSKTASRDRDFEIETSCLILISLFFVRQAVKVVSSDSETVVVVYNAF